MKILVIFTGGTIGSAVSDGWISPNDDMKYLLLSEFRKKSDIEVEFETLNPYAILSENLSAENINMLINCIRENKDNYDGIIVTHGTDTLQYTAVALSFAFAKDTVPVVLVSSNYPLKDERANGVDNFICAVEFIKSGSSRGVFVSYKNKNEEAKIHLASRIVSHMEASDEIFSLGNESALFGKAVENAAFCENSGVLSVAAMPGESYCYDLSKYKAVIIRPYHSGTLNTASKNFASFCEDAKRKNIPVFLVNVPSGVTYESSKEYENLGITVLPMCSFPAIYIKTWLAVSLNKDIREFVLTPIDGEV